MAEVLRKHQHVVLLDDADVPALSNTMGDLDKRLLHVLVLNDSEITALSNVMEDFAETASSNAGSWADDARESVRALRELYDALGLVDYMQEMEE